MLVITRWYFPPKKDRQISVVPSVCRAVLALRVPRMSRASSTDNASSNQARPMARAQTSEGNSPSRWAYNGDISGIYTYIHIYIIYIIYLFIYLFIYLSIYLSIYLYLSLSIYIYMYIYLSLSIYLYIYVYIFIYIRTCTCTCLYVRIYGTYVHAYMRMCVYAYVRICVYCIHACVCI